MENQNLTTVFLDEARLRIRDNVHKIEACLEKLPDDAIWKRPNAHSNSIGNLLLHLSGNLRQYIIVGVGGAPDTRNRPAEFAQDGGLSRTELRAHFTATIQEVQNVLEKTTEDDLLRFRNVQVYTLSGLGCIFHATEHLSYHTGQIIFWTKLLLNVDMGFYAHLNE